MAGRTSKESHQAQRITKRTGTQILSYGVSHITLMQLLPVNHWGPPKRGGPSMFLGHYKTRRAFNVFGGFQKDCTFGRLTAT